MDGKVISIHGIDSTGLCLYLTRAFHSIRKKVAIVDNSSSGTVSDCMPLVVESEGFINYRGVDVYAKKNTMSLKNNYDVLIAYYGMTLPIDTDQFDLKLLIIDQQRTSINFTQEYIKYVKGNFVLVHMNYIESELTSEIDLRVDALYQLSGSLQESYQLPYSVLDYKYLLAAQYFSVFYYDKLSTNLKKLILKIVKHIVKRDLDIDKFTKQFMKMETELDLN